MTHSVLYIHEWSEVKKLSQEYIRLVNELLKYSVDHQIHINLQGHFENTQKLAHILGDSVLEEESIENRILSSLRDGKKTFTEIKSSFTDVPPQTLKDIMLKMEEYGDLEFYVTTGLWMIP